MAVATISRREAGSFRDPSGYVFRREGRVFRAIAPEAAVGLQEFLDTAVCRQLLDEHLLVGTAPVAQSIAAVLRAEHPGFDFFLEHEPLPLITYPYEWPISALADAGILTLEIQQRLLHAGYSLKDATAYNVQFANGRPVFIDLASIERPARRDVWPALGQFHQMFTIPLLLARHHGWDLQSYFLAKLGGRTVEQVVSSLGRFHRWHPRYLIDVTLPAVLQQRFARNSEPREIPANAAASPAPQLANLRRLRKKIEQLATRYHPSGPWTRYADGETYSAESRQAKRELVRQWLRLMRPTSVLDAGCNTGEYTDMAAECGARVVSVDADHDTVELLYRRLRAHPSPVMPMVVDLCSPSPAIGFLNREREAFLGRVKADCVLALALLHHLRVSGNLQLPAICELLSLLSERNVILEFVPAADPAFQRLTSFRRESFSDYTLEACRAALGANFEIVREQEIAGSYRTLLWLRKREAP